MAVREKQSGGSLTRKVLRAADIADAAAVKALLAGSNPDDVETMADGSRRLRAGLVPMERRIERQRDACAEAIAANITPAEHPSPAWYAAEVHWRLEKALQGADDETKLRLWLAFEAGRLMKEASLVHPEIRLDQDDARREAAQRGLDAHNAEARRESAERNAALIAEAQSVAARFPTYLPYRIAGMLHQSAGLSRKQVLRIIREHLPIDGHARRRVPKK